MAIQEWEQELIDLGWDRNPDHYGLAVFTYKKTIRPEYVIVELYERVYQVSGGITLRQIGRQVYKVIISNIHYTEINVYTGFDVEGIPMIVGAEYHHRKGFLDSTPVSTHSLCWGTLDKKIENIKRLPDLFKTMRKSYIADDTPIPVSLVHSGIFEVEPSEVIF